MQTNVYYLTYQPTVSAKDYELIEKISKYLEIDFRKESIVNLQYYKIEFKDTDLVIAFGNQAFNIAKTLTNNLYCLPPIHKLFDIQSNESYRIEAMEILETIKLVIIANSNIVPNARYRYDLLINMKEIMKQRGIKGFILDKTFVYVDEPSVLYKENIFIDDLILAQLTKELLNINNIEILKKND